MSKIHFHLDENVPIAVAEGLRRKGINATTTEQAGLKQKSDREQLAYACQNGRVLVTHDRDFLKLHEKGVTHFGIVYCQQNKRSIGQIIRFLVLVYEIMDSQEMVGQLEYL